MKRTSLLAAGPFALLLALAAAQPGHAQDAVIPMSTFSFDISGFNSAGTVGYLLTPDEVTTFGATTTFTAAGINGQNITITSSEAVGATSTTDTFTVSTPTNFLTTNSVNGTKITQLDFDLGDANSGSQPVNVLLPISSDTATGNILYGTSNTSFTLTPVTTLGTGTTGIANTSYAAQEGVSTGTTAISGIAVHSFPYSITYATLAAAPEPSQTAAFSLGILGLGALALRARRRSVTG